MLKMVFDLETTGFPNKYSQIRKADILQFAYIIFDDQTKAIQEADNRYFLPSLNKIEPGAYETNGLSEEFIYTYTTNTFEDYISQLTEKLDNVHGLIGHNIKNFDIVVLKTYNNSELNTKLSSLGIEDTMTDFTDKLYKVVCNKNMGKWQKEWISLQYCFYNLMRKGYDLDKVISDYKSVFCVDDSQKQNYFHNAAFDTYVNYLVYLDIRGE